jgi:hypothetical protein
MFFRMSDASVPVGSWSLTDPVHHMSGASGGTGYAVSKESHGSPTSPSTPWRAALT